MSEKKIIDERALLLNRRSFLGKSAMGIGGVGLASLLGSSFLEPSSPLITGAGSGAASNSATIKGILDGLHHPAKVKRVMAKLDATAPHEVLLVLDAGTGQNAVAQAAQFHQTVGVTGLALTKLDGTAKGGVIFALSKKLGIPVRFIGIGESIDDLQPFEAAKFTEALFGNN